MSLTIEFDGEDLRPLVQLAVAEALDRMEEERIGQTPVAGRRRLPRQVERVLGDRSDNE